MSLSPIAERYARLDALDARELDDTTAYLAGGTDLVPLQRSGVTSLDTLLDLKSSGLGRSIESNDGAWHIGSLATLSDLEDHVGLADDAAAVREAMQQTATRQIRNRATIGGNLLQRPRCSYFRDADISCWMKGGSGCPAREGRTEYLGVVAPDEDSPCVAVQPSDLASVLVMLDATVDITVPGGGNRQVDVADFLAPPTGDRRSLNTLGDGEIIERVMIPAGSPDRRTTYRKAMDRAVWQFALVGLAVSIDVDESGSVSSAALVASGVGAVPRLLTTTCDTLVGSVLDDRSIDSAARAATDGLTPLADNRYKLDLLQGLVRQALRDLAG